MRSIAEIKRQDGVNSLRAMHIQATEANRERLQKQSPPPEIVEHHCYVVRVCRRTSNGKWFYTVAKDGVRLRESGPYDEKPEILHSVALKQ